MNFQLVVALIAAVASPIASVVCVAIQGKKSRQESASQERKRREQAAQSAKITEEKQNEILKMCLCTEIHNVYHMYKDVKRIPDTVWLGVCKMYKQYTEVGGNMYITSRVEEMKEWEKV